jgi:hypothetical protein
MKTRTSMLSSLAIAALATVTLNSSDALAKSGGGMGGGMGGSSRMAVRTTPVVVKQIKTVTTTSAVKKLSTTAVVTGKLDPKVVTGKLDPSKVVTFPGKVDPGKLNPGTMDPGKVVTFPGKVDPGKIITFPPGKIVDPLPPKDPPAPPAPPAPPPVVVNPPPVIVTPPAVSLGVAAATVAAEPVGCTYEKSVRKLAGGGLQRVLIKICPDDVVVR